MKAKRSRRRAKARVSNNECLRGLREWFLRQIVDQLDGDAPTPWTER